MAIEYTVVVKEGVTKADIIDSLSRDTTLDSSVNSNEVPDRAIAMSTSQQRPSNPRVFEIELDDEEVILLNNNPDILAVDVSLEFDKGWLCSPQDLTFNREAPDTTTDINYGLWRHTQKENDFIVGAGSRTETWANVAQAGYGVDVVVLEGLGNWGLSEFDDETGVVGGIVPSDLNGYNTGSRFVSLDWSVPAKSFGVENVPERTDGVTWYGKMDYGQHLIEAEALQGDQNLTTRHATMSMSMVAGNKYGWARWARIYSCPTYIAYGQYAPLAEWNVGGYMRAAQGSSYGVTPKYYHDAIRMFHEWKKVLVSADPDGPYAHPLHPGVVRPTVVTASWAPVEQYTDITGVYFRDRWFGDVLDTIQDDSYPTPEYAADGPRYSTNNYGYGTTGGPIPPIYKFGIVRGANPSQFGDLFKTSGRPVQAGPFFPTQAPAMQADVQSMTDAGVIYLSAAHNTELKVDVPGGIDYDNFFTYKETAWDEKTVEGILEVYPSATRLANGYPMPSISELEQPVGIGGDHGIDYFGTEYWQTKYLETRRSGMPVFYNRGAFNISNTSILVGNMRTSNLPITSSDTPPSGPNQELAARTSTRGPRIDIWAAGEGTVVAPSYEGGPPVMFGGTSAATPQAAGMVAILAGKFPTTTPAQMRAFVRSNSNFHSSNGILDYHTIFGITPISNTTIAGDWGANGDFNYFGSGWPYSPTSTSTTHRGLMGASGNVAYLDLSFSNDPSQLTTLEPDLDYFGHTESAKYDAVIADPHLYSNLNYTSAMSEKFKPRVGSDWGFRYYKFIGYDDFERTVPSGEELSGGEVGGEGAGTSDFSGPAISNLIIYETTKDGGERVLLGDNQKIKLLNPSTLEPFDDTQIKIPYGVSSSWIGQTPGATTSRHGESSWGSFWYYFQIKDEDGTFWNTGIASNCTRRHKLGSTWNSTTDAWGHEYFRGHSNRGSGNYIKVFNNRWDDYPDQYGRETGAVYYPHHALSCFNHHTFFDTLNAGGTAFAENLGVGETNFSAGLKVEKNWSVSASGQGYYGDYYSLMAPSSNYSFIPALNSRTEFLIDFGRQVHISNIKWNTLSRNHFNTSYIDVYGSNAPFDEATIGPIPGSIKIAELNRGDAYIANIHFTDSLPPIGGPIHTNSRSPSGRWLDGRWKHPKTWVRRLLRSQGIVGFNEGDPYANGVMSKEEAGAGPVDGTLNVEMLADNEGWMTGWSTQLHELLKMNPTLVGHAKNSSLGGPSKSWSSSTPSANIST
jgi:hypothetical protein